MSKSPIEIAMQTFETAFLSHTSTEILNAKSTIMVELPCPDRLIEFIKEIIDKIDAVGGVGGATFNYFVTMCFLDGLALHALARSDEAANEPSV